MPDPVRHGLAFAARALFELDESALSPPRAALVFVARLAWLTTRGFFRDRLQMRAASLAFATVLAFVPMAALAFAIADALGATDSLIERTIEPFLLETIGPADDPTLPTGVRTLRTMLDGLIESVRSTHAAGLGVAGLFVVLWSLARVVRGVEEAFAHVFQHRGPPRTVWKRMRAFAIVAATTPIGLGYAMVTAVLSHDTIANAWVAALVPFGAVRDLLLFVVPPIVVAITLLILYLELPDAEVRWRSAALGASLAAIGWYGVQLAHIRFQVSLARYDALYSGFGAFPILMLSIHVSWVMVLLGAQVIAAHQDAPTLRQLGRGAPRDHAERQALAVRASIALGRHARDVPLRALASEMGVGVTALRSVLDELAAHGLVVARITRTDRRYQLAVDPATLRASTVLDALERAPGGPDLPWDESEAHVHELLVARRAAASSSGGDRTIADLMGNEPRRAGLEGADLDRVATAAERALRPADETVAGDAPGMGEDDR